VEESAGVSAVGRALGPDRRTARRPAPEEAPVPVRSPAPLPLAAWCPPDGVTGPRNRRTDAVGRPGPDGAPAEGSAAFLETLAQYEGCRPDDLE
jgi:hypothetical protein